MTIPLPAPEPVIPYWVTLLFAIWGAALATFTLGWTLYRDLLDRPKVKVEARVRRVVGIEGGTWAAISPTVEMPGASKRLFVVMTVVNVRRRPVRWEGWGGIYKTPVEGKTGFVIIPHQLPKTLNEGDSHSEYTELEANLRPANDNVHILKAWDTTGRNWKLSWWQMRKLRQEALEATKPALTAPANSNEGKA